MRGSHVFRRIAIFYGISLCGPVLVGLMLRFGGDNLPTMLVSFAIALAMPFPLLGAIVASQGEGVRVLHRIRDEFSRPFAVLGLPLVAFLVWYAVCVVLIYAHAGTQGVVSHQELINRVTQTTGSSSAGASLPPVPILVGLTIVNGLIAGFTVNSLLAFGEEYGWRDFLWGALHPWGRLATVGVIGVLWGLWHAPLILLIGYNFPDNRPLGVVIMVIFTTAASFVMDTIRRGTGGAVGPALFHGTINAAAPNLLLVTKTESPLLAPPMGVFGAIAFIATGLAIIMVRRWSERGTTSPATTQPTPDQM